MRRCPCCQASSSKVAGELRSIRIDAHDCKLRGAPGSAGSQPWAAALPAAPQTFSGPRKRRITILSMIRLLPVAAAASRLPPPALSASPPPL